MNNSLTTQQAIVKYKIILDALQNGYLPNYSFNGMKNRINIDNDGVDFVAYSGSIVVYNTGWTEITEEMLAIMTEVDTTYQRNKQLYRAAYDNALSTIRAQYATKKMYERIRIDGKRRYVRV